MNPDKGTVLSRASRLFRQGQAEEAKSVTFEDFITSTVKEQFLQGDIDLS
jgi:hypothetical protein